MSWYPTPEIPPVLAPYAEIIRAYWKPCLRISRKENDERPWQSYLGGLIPYWPADFIYPRDEMGSPLAFLLQLNFADMPPLPDFPTEGLLQLFIESENGQFYYTQKAIGYYREDICTDLELLIDQASVTEILRNYEGSMPEFLTRNIKNSGPMAFQLIGAPPDETDYLYGQLFPAHASLPFYAAYEKSDNAKEEKNVSWRLTTAVHTCSIVSWQRRDFATPWAATGDSRDVTTLASTCLTTTIGWCC